MTAVNRPAAEDVGAAIGEGSAARLVEDLVVRVAEAVVEAAPMTQAVVARMHWGVAPWADW